MMKYESITKYLGQYKTVQKGRITKYILAILSCLLLIINIVGCGGSQPSESSTKETVMHQIYLDVDFETNILFSTYDVAVRIDGNEIGKIRHGDYFTYLTEVQEGEHEIMFFKDGDDTVNGKTTVEVKGETTFKCKIHCKNDEIVIDEIEIISSISGASIEVDDLIGMNLEEALNLLKDGGLVNVKYEAEGSDSIWETGNWVVISQSVTAGSNIDKSDEIRLVCIKADSYINNTLKGLNILEAVEKAKELGYEKMEFREQDTLADISESILSLSEEELNNLTVESARDISSDEHKLEMMVDYSVKYEVPDVTGLTLEEAADIFGSTEFINVMVESDDGSVIEEYEGWVVISQSVPSKEMIKAGDEIILICNNTNPSEKSAVSSGGEEETAASTQVAGGLDEYYLKLNQLFSGNEYPPDASNSISVSSYGLKKLTFSYDAGWTHVVFADGVSGDWINELQYTSDFIVIHVADGPIGGVFTSNYTYYFVDKNIIISRRWSAYDETRDKIIVHILPQDGKQFYQYDSQDAVEKVMFDDPQEALDYVKNY